VKNEKMLPVSVTDFCPIIVAMSNDPDMLISDQQACPNFSRVPMWV